MEPVRCAEDTVDAFQRGILLMVRPCESAANEICLLEVKDRNLRMAALFKRSLLLSAAW
jgi:hypothetical protein